LEVIFKIKNEWLFPFAFSTISAVTICICSAPAPVNLPQVDVPRR
jgi:hypothetical protein